MTIAYNIKMDLTRPEILPTVAAVQGDTYTREVRISLHNAGVPWELPDGHNVTIRYGKPDGTMGVYDTLPDGSVAWASECDTVSVMLCPQMLTVPGIVPTQISISVEDRTISTFAFVVDVAADPSKGAVQSENYTNWRNTFLPQVTGAKVGQYLQIAKVDADGRVVDVTPVDAAAGEIDSADTVPGYVRAETERVAAVVQERQNANTLTFISASDFHYATSQQADGLTHMGQAMALLRDMVLVDFTASLGDMVWDGGESIAQAMQAMRFVGACLGGGDHQLRHRGNHDCLYSHDTGLTDAQIFANIGAWNHGAEYGNRQGGYCYLDFPDRKIRVVCVNSSEHAKGGCLITAEQAAWLETTLDLSNKGADWRSVILSHHPLDWGKDGGVAITDILNNATGLICAIHGHTHNFKVGTIAGTDVPRFAVPNACNGRENEYTTAYGVEWGEETTYSKTAGTAQDTAFCVVTIDLEAKKIYADHYGAGYSRVIPYDDVVLNSYSVTNNLADVYTSNTVASISEGASYTATLTPEQGYVLDAVTVTMGGADITATVYSGGVVSIQSVTGDIVITATAVESSTDSGNYTNLVATAQEMGSTAVYNGTGYKDGYRLSSSSPYESTGSGYVATGYMPYTMIAEKLPGVIYIKGATWSEVSNCRVYFFDDSKATIVGPQIQGGGSGNNALSKFFTLETLGTDYFRLVPVDAGGGKWAAQNIAATVTNMAFFRVSLAGSGAGLIITVDEPIE